MPKYEYDIAGYAGTISDTDCEEAGRAANDFSVSLFNGNDLKGSAALVSVGNIHGLLTADHVWQCILNGEGKDHFGMVIGSHLQRFEYPFEGCTPTIVGKYSAEHDEQGPDLTFIRLDNPLKLETIKSRKSFYPLNSEKGKALERIPAIWQGGSGSWRFTREAKSCAISLRYQVNDGLAVAFTRR